MQMRASWDNKYTKQDVMRNVMVMFMTVRAAYSGRVDLTEEWEAVADLVKKLATNVPQPRDLPAGPKRTTRKDDSA
jgi:hypothetical protein